MISTDLTSLIADLRAEGSNLAEVEVKSARGGFPKSVASTLSAFGNTPGGGTIVFGLDESVGFEAVGVYDAAACKQALGSAVRHAVDPPLTFTAATHRFEGVDLVVADIDELPGSAKPCRLAGSRKAYLRSYDGDHELSELELQAFIANRATPRFDAEPVDGSTRDDLDDELVALYLETCKQNSSALARLDDADILFRTGVLVGDERTPSMAGLLALGAYPQQHFPNLVIQASASPGPDDPPGTRAVDPRRFDGPVPTMLDEALRWVVRNTRSRVRFGPDGQGRDESEYPAEAVRELLSNALVHRDLGPYARGEAITLRLERERLVVSNPGGLWGLTTARLGRTGVTSARNGYLVRICQNVRSRGDRRVVEALASGIPTVLRALKDAGMVAPRFHDQAIRFSVIVPNHTLLSRDDLRWLADATAGLQLGDVHRHVLVSMRHGESWSNKSLRETFPMDSRDARRVLGELVDSGLAEAHGERGGRVYRLAGGKAGTRPDRRSGVTDTRQAVLGALKDGPTTRSEIEQRTGLSYRQVQHTLHTLRREGVVVLDGGQGHQSSSYRLT